MGYNADAHLWYGVLLNKKQALKLLKDNNISVEVLDEEDDEYCSWTLKDNIDGALEDLVKPLKGVSLARTAYCEGDDVEPFEFGICTVQHNGDYYENKKIRLSSIDPSIKWTEAAKKLSIKGKGSWYLCASYG